MAAVTVLSEFTEHVQSCVRHVPLCRLYSNIGMLPLSANDPQKIYNLYNKVGYNCFIAAAIYVLFGAFSCCQMRLNKQKVSSCIWLY